MTGKDDELSEDDASSGSDDLGGSLGAVACCPLLRIRVLLLSAICCYRLLMGEVTATRSVMLSCFDPVLSFKFPGRTEA